MSCEFLCLDSIFSIDATTKSEYLGRLVNHSYIQPNVCPQLHVDADGRPHIILVAKQKIKVGVELFYDYGETDNKTILENPWLRNT